MPYSSFNSLLLALFSCLLLCQCGESEEPLVGPSQITLSHQSIYEQLPAFTRVAKLETDINSNDIRFLLVSGDGSTHNSDFRIEGNLLKTQKVLDHSDGATREIRIKANDGTVDYEQSLTITINKFEGPIPSISSSSFNNNGVMPMEFGADHGNVSPDLTIENIPSQTQSIAITMIDIDASNSLHWSVWNIPSSFTMISSNQNWTTDTVEGDCAFGEGYVGPFPPSTHTYKITVHFLTETIDLTADQFGLLESEITGRLIAQASIFGKYEP